MESRVEHVKSRVMHDFRFQKLKPLGKIVIMIDIESKICKHLTGQDILNENMIINGQCNQLNANCNQLIRKDW